MARFRRMVDAAAVVPSSFLVKASRVGARGAGTDSNGKRLPGCLPGAAFGARHGK